MRQEIAKELVLRALVERIDDAESLSSDLNSVTAKNIELSRQKTSAQCRVRELEKIEAERQALLLEKESDLSAAQEELGVARRNLDAVLASAKK